MYKKALAGFICIVVLGFFGVKHSFAATLSSVSDTVTTSRPSASAPLNADQAASATQVTIVDNKSVFIASDSATFWPDTGETINTQENVASMSAASAGTRIVYFTGTVSNTHHKGDAVVVPITAMHTVGLTTVTAIPSSGKIVLTFPTLAVGDANNPASPSATTFRLNGLAQANVQVWDTTASSDITVNFTANSGSIVMTTPTPGSPPIVTLTQGTTTTIPSNHAIKIFLGCTTLSSGNCTVQVPRLINPTKSQGANSGAGVNQTNADTWQLSVATQDGSSNTLDTSKAVIGTIESVQVQAQVDPTMTFTIQGIANGTAVNTNNSGGCANTETTNTGIPSLATFVNLGVINVVPAVTTKLNNISAQTLTVSTNAVNGYSLTATSSGHLINPANGFFFADNGTTPAVFPTTMSYGIHACGLDTHDDTVISSTFWNTTADNTNCNTQITGSAGNLCKYGWPTQTSAVNVAYKSSGPIINSQTNQPGMIAVEYAADSDASVPPGTYTTLVTYVATPTF